MDIYSFLRSVGALIGNMLAGIAGRWLAIDGLMYATLAVAVAALALPPPLGPVRSLTPERRT